MKGGENMSPRALLSLLVGLTVPAVTWADPRVVETYGKLPLQFEANRGQAHKNVQFLAHGPGYGIYLTSREAVIVLAKEQASVRMALEGGNQKPQANGMDELPGKANYLIDKDPSKWRIVVPTYARVRYREVYPGIDLVYYGNQRRLEYDFVVAPGANPGRIGLSFKGTDKLEIDAQGDLILHAGDSVIRQHKPVVYQEIDGTRKEID